MRLLETLRYPALGSWGNVGFQFPQTAPFFGIFTGLNVDLIPGAPAGRFTPARFGSPRLNREWSIERIVVNNTLILFEGNSTPATNYVSFNFQAYLNDVPVSSTVSSVYEMAVGATPVLGSVPLTAQNGPLQIEPFQSIRVLSGDQLTVAISVGSQDPVPSGTLNMGFLFHLQLLGSSDPRVESRNG